jgi:hypothetical protein
VASDHRGHAAHPAPPEEPDATHERRAPGAVEQASLAQRLRENLLAGSPPWARPRHPGLTKVTPRPTSASAASTYVHSPIHVPPTVHSSRFTPPEPVGGAARSAQRTGPLRSARRTTLTSSEATDPVFERRCRGRHPMADASVDNRISHTVPSGCLVDGHNTGHPQPRS